MAYKQAIVVRRDLDMGKGKMAAQVAHASVGALKRCRQSAVDSWEDGGSKKVVLKASGEDEILQLEKTAKRGKVPCFLVRDAGRTQIEEGTVTALGIGPATDSEVDGIVGKLKLL